MQEIFRVDLSELGEGVVLEGKYALAQWIRTDYSGAFFSATGPEGESLIVKLVPDRGPETDRQLDTWQRSRHLRHPHLMEPRDAGRLEAGGASHIYAVFERPDEELAAALAQGPLSEEETHGVLDAVLGALRYLHGQGLVHGAVDAEHVAAVGDTVKLATDTLRESDDLEGHAEDVRQLGELLKKLRDPHRPGEALAAIVRNATEPDLRHRWTLAEIAARVPPLPPARTAPAPLPTPAPAPPAISAPAPPAIPSAAQVVPENPPSLPPPARRAAPPASPPPFPKWIFAGVAAVLLLILALNLGRKPAPIPHAPPVPLAPAAVPESLPPADPRPSPREVRPAKAETPAIWRVVAFTYGSRDIAAKKARQLNQKWPDLHAAVFAAEEHRGYYLVVLGGSMNREEAVRMQRKARGRGLPRDTYVQNYQR